MSIEQPTCFRIVAGPTSEIIHKANESLKPVQGPKGVSTFEKPFPTIFTAAHPDDECTAQPIAVYPKTVVEVGTDMVVVGQGEVAPTDSDTTAKLGGVAIVVYNTENHSGLVDFISGLHKVEKVEE